MDHLFSCSAFDGGFQLFFQQLVNGLAKGSIYSLIALGYTMVYGIVELINFAHGDIFMLGSFIALALLNLLGVTDMVEGGIIPVIIILLVVLLGTAVLTGLLGVGVERIAYKPLRHAPKLAPLISAIGMSFILQNVGQIWRGPAALPFPDVFINQQLNILGVRVGLK